MADKTPEEIDKEYKRTLRMLDGAERELEELSDALKKSVTRLSIAAQGNDSSVDKLLKALRTTVKNKIDLASLDTNLDKLFTLINRLDDAKSSPDTVVATANLFETLSHVIKGANLSSSANKYIDEIKTLIENKSNDDVIAQKIISQINNLAIAINLKEAQKSAPSDNLLFNFINELNVTLGLKVADLSTDEKVKDVLDSLTIAISTSQADKYQTNVVMVNLLDKLSLPNHVLKDQQRLVKLLDGNEIQLPQWKTVVKNIAELVNQSLSKIRLEKKELQSFVEKITQQLTDIEAYLLSTQADRQQHKDSSVTLQVEVDKQVEHINQEVTSADDLSSLKASVQKHLSNIKNNFQQFKKEEKTRDSDAQKKFKKVHIDLALSQKETENLKQQLKESQEKLLRDTLTGVPNRMAYQERIEAEEHRFKRNNKPLCLALWDIDFFKKVNDNFGHDAGDRVLKMFANLIQDKIRKVDFFARVGGEEFIMLMPETELSNALSLNNKIRESLASSGFNYKGKAFPITASVGIAAFKKGLTADAVLKKADIALYASKENGRNRCTVQD